MQRVILHCDINNCFASIEAALNPALRGKAIAVCGSQKERHGIVLAKSEEAKRFGVKTAQAIWQAKRKCPHLIIVAPHYETYLQYSKRVRSIYGTYTNQVESFGLDECWLDLTHSLAFLGQRSAAELAFEIKERIKVEVGITLSVGVSFNKVFAKLASDLRKPDAVSVITKEGFRHEIWALGADQLLGVGGATREKLLFYGIQSIGDLARSPVQLLKRILGKNGTQLWEYANGLDNSPVLRNDLPIPIKSMGHGQTFARDLLNLDEVRCGFIFLAQNLSHRLQLQGLRADSVQITVRDSALVFKQFQGRAPLPTQSAHVLAQTAFGLFCAHYRWQKDVRALTITAFGLCHCTQAIQGELFVEREQLDKHEAIQKSIFEIRERFGKKSIQPASILGDPIFSATLPPGIGPPTHHW